ncbi:NDP-hexose 2,3-dehydratase family protein [Spirillospora sp. NBC_01491]|uniref:NDP-hexose 2,3-dehydratase family protein n=1 Tax=Spirillospora sp. NBC_01491 TaxID=2976007 RepID=UPI002E32A1AA|nr:NDP-hexose 2,3-dehydratase family protein [Spirillospora sp. NBC_01491]
MTARPAPLRIARSALCRDGGAGRDSGNGRAAGPDGVQAWLDQAALRTHMEVTRVPLSGLAAWTRDPGTGDLGHRSGGFFTVRGLEVDHPLGPVPHWSQPIIDQPEVGILGVLVKEFGGVLHCLAQAKVEPGNLDGLQLAPTVQATYSNYTRVHRGLHVPYLGYFLDVSRHHVIADVCQSEHAAWFLRKRNRNMVVEVAGDVEAAPGFRWMTVGQLHRLLTRDDLVNMDLRSVLSCLPFAGPDVRAAFGARGDGFRAALTRSCDAAGRALHGDAEILRWIAETRARTAVRTRRAPLDGLRHWHSGDDAVTHESGLFFDVIGVEVEAAGREVGRWAQPMLRPHGTAVVAFVVTRIDGVLHALVHALAEPGSINGVELAPTVQCTPENHGHLPPSARPAFLDEVLRAGPDQIRFTARLSEEGGRLYHARGRYLIVETEPGGRWERPGYRWLTLRQLAALLRRGHYVNVQARSLVTCLFSLTGDTAVA